MPVKKKKTATVKAGKTASFDSSMSLSDDRDKINTKPAMTQVVEVVEEEATQPSITDDAPSSPHMPLEQESTEAPVTQNPSVAPNIPSELTPAPPVASSATPVGDTSASEGEKRKEVVGELFQPKESSVPTSDVLPEISVHPQKNSHPIVLWAIVTVVAALVVGGSILYMKKGKGMNLTSLHLPTIGVVATPTPTKVSSPSATPLPTVVQLDKSQLTIQVVNGGGKVGAATKMKLFLEGKGYKVAGTANADNYTFDTTVIAIKSTKAQYLPGLTQDLAGTYTLGTSSANLSSDVSYDARVTVGK